MPIASVNPATGETLATFDALTREQIDAKLDRARAAFAEWRRRPVAERAAIVGRAGELLDRDRDRYGRLMTLEMGKLLSAAREEAAKCASACRYYAEHAGRFLADEPMDADGNGRAYVAYDPIGPVLAIMPWNFPFWQVIRFAVPALCAGNVGLLKHSSNVPQCALALEALFREAGAPEGVFQALLVGSDAVGDIIADDRVAAVTLTGSTPAGRRVASAAGEHIKKSVLELGGSDAFVVLADADVERAAQVAVTARTINNGQSCIAAKRFIVEDAVYDAFASRFVAGMRALRVGDPMSPDTKVGPLATPQIADDLAKQVDASVQAGARVLIGGHRLSGPGSFFEPTVLADAPEGSPAAVEELFGPVATLFRARDERDAVRLANATVFGLGASLWTRDEGRAARLAREIEAGMVFVNGMVASDPRYPFGGVKQSGYGRELAAVGMREFLNVKTVRMSFGDGGDVPRHTGTE